MKELTENKQNLSAESNSEEMPMPTPGKTLYITPDTKGFDYLSVLDQIIQCVNMGDVLAKIQTGTQYVVQIPTELQEAFESGKYFMMQNQKNGKMWPSLMKIAENGKHQVVTPLSISKQEFAQGSPVQDLTVGYHNVLMQQQVAKLASMLEDTYRLVERIEHGQKADRIGTLEAGKDGLLLALSMPEGNQRTMQINSSRQNILVARGQIGQMLQDRVEEFKELPKFTLGCFFKELKHSGYLKEKDCEVSEMQDYYDLYLQATKLLAASYAIDGDLKTAEESFILGEKFVGGINFSKVKSIEKIHHDLGDMFYSYPVDFIVAERTACLEEAKKYDYVAIEVSGENLLEVISDGESEKISEEIIE